MTTARERSLRRRVRELWGEVLKERTDHTRARRLLQELERKKAELADERRRNG